MSLKFRSWPRSPRPSVPEPGEPRSRRSRYRRKRPLIYRRNDLIRESYQRGTKQAHEYSGLKTGDDTQTPKTPPEYACVATCKIILAYGRFSGKLLIYDLDKLLSLLSVQDNFIYWSTYILWETCHGLIFVWRYFVFWIILSHWRADTDSMYQVSIYWIDKNSNIKALNTER